MAVQGPFKKYFSLQNWILKIQKWQKVGGHCPSLAGNEGKDNPLWIEYITAYKFVWNSHSGKMFYRNLGGYSKYK